MSNILTVFSVISLILTIAGLLGGFYAFKNGMTRTANEVQERVINALESEITALRQRLDDMKEDNIRLQLIIDTICAALESRGLAVTIDGHMVSIHDAHSSTTTITRIQEQEDGL